MNKKAVIASLAFVISIALVAALYYVDHAYATQINIEEIVVAKTFIPANTVLAKEHLVIKKYPKIAITDEMRRTEAELVGLETNVPIGKDNVIYIWQTSKQSLNPKDNEIIVKIPKDYLLSVPGSLRRGDMVTITANDPDSKESFVVFDNIRVAYVKQGANAEVVSVQQPNAQGVVSPTSNKEAYEQYRFNASGVVADIELLLTLEQWKVLDELANGMSMSIKNSATEVNMLIDVDLEANQNGDVAHLDDAVKDTTDIPPVSTLSSEHIESLYTTRQEPKRMKFVIGYRGETMFGGEQ